MRRDGDLKDDEATRPCRKPCSKGRTCWKLGRMRYDQASRTAAHAAIAARIAMLSKSTSLVRMPPSTHARPSCTRLRYRRTSRCKFGCDPPRRMIRVSLCARHQADCQLISPKVDALSLQKRANIAASLGDDMHDRRRRLVTPQARPRRLERGYTHGPLLYVR
jgi:hypothetical protein